MHVLCVSCSYSTIFNLVYLLNGFVSSYVSCIAGCPYEGPVPPERVAQVARTFFELGCYEISLGDTTGVGHPEQIERVLRAVCEPPLGIPVRAIALHCHDTHGRALANIQQALTVFPPPLH